MEKLGKSQMESKSILPKSSQFFLMSIIVSITVLILTLLITLNTYVWYESRSEGKSPLEGFLVDNHSIIMIAALLTNGYSILMLRLLRICSSYTITLNCLGTIHALMNAVSLVLSLSPIYVLLSGIIGNRVSLHFYSIHCWIGVITFVGLIVQFLSALAFYVLNYIHVLSQQVMDQFKNLHLIIGYSVFYLLALSAVLGISEMNAVTREKFPKYYTFPILFPNLMALSIVFFGLIVFYFAFWQKRIEMALIMIRNKTSDEKERFLKRIKDKQERRRRIVIQHPKEQ